MKKKIISLLIILLLYIAAVAAAAAVIAVLRPYIGNWLLLLFIGDVAGTVIVYAYGVIIKNSSVYDPYWSVQSLAVIAGFYIMTGTPFNAYHLFALLPLSAWAFRLTVNWAKGFTDLKWQDWRYVMLKEKNPKIWQIVNFGGINMMPTILVFGGTIPILQYMAAGSFNPGLSILGCTVSFLAMLLQTTADKQLADFKKLNTGGCIDSGLWKYSRHPNYLGEVCLWWGFFIMATPVFNLLTIAGALAITLLFVFISIPLMEKRMAGRPGYAEYKKQVSRILLLPRRKIANLEAGANNE